MLLSIRLIRRCSRFLPALLCWALMTWGGGTALEAAGTSGTDATPQAVATAPVFFAPPPDLDQTPFEADSTRLGFGGTIGSDIPVFVTFDRATPEQVGTLYYGKTGGRLFIEVSFTGTNGFTILEKFYDEKNDKETHTGTFTGTHDANWEKLAGTWTSPDGKRSYPFELMRVVTYRTIKSKVPASLSYPRFVLPEFEKFNPAIAKACLEAYPDVASMVVDNLSDFEVEDQQSLDRRNAINATRNLDVVYVDPTLVSLMAEESSYYGGAHGGTRFAVLNLVAEPATGKTAPGVPAVVRTLGIGDLIGNSPACQKAIAGWVVRELMKQRASLVQKDSVATFAADLAADRLGCVTFGPQGLVFHFEPYEMGCYAEGAFHATVPFRVFDRWIPETSPLRRFLK